ncbi:hypothetical protein [Kitasatospora sp. NPDC050463]|uniref:hypothetical protein n=1 Tax=Kitasatospora sp. NPDC050463 TaxID=3155786 RepID=UPI0033D91938
MSPLTTRRATTVRSLAGTVLAAALLVPAATACSSTSAAGGTTAASTPAVPVATAPAATVPAAPTTSATQGATAPVAPAATSGASGATAPAAPPTSPRAAAPATTPAKTKSPVRTQTLVDGSTAEVQAVGDQNYVARIVNSGAVLATLETHDSDAGLDGNGMFVVLSLDGQVHSWMGGEHQGPGTFKLAGGWTAKVTKVGELRYRAQILGSDNAVNGTLEANQHDAGAVANGVYIVLSAGGEISAHM